MLFDNQHVSVKFEPLVLAIFLVLACFGLVLILIVNALAKMIRMLLHTTKWT